MQIKHLAWLGSRLLNVHAEQVQGPPAGGGGAGALLVRSLAFCRTVNNLCRGPILIPISLRSSSSRSRNVVSSMASSRSRLSRSLRPMLARSVVIASSPRLKPDELDTEEVMLQARDRPDRGLDPPEVMELVRLLAGVGRPSFWRRYAFLSLRVRSSSHSK